LEKIRIASRHSELALWQANTVGKMLDCDYEIIEMNTRGDENLEVPISALGANGAFAKEIQVALLAGEADMAIHSAKDLPSETPDGLSLVSIPFRGDTRDALIGSTLDSLPYAARVATGSSRRRAQLAAIRPDLVFEDLRGNIATRLNKASNFDAVVLAHAALQRLEKQNYATEILPVGTMLPQVGQGAIAIECRSDDQESIDLAKKVNDVDAFRCVTAERAFSVRAWRRMFCSLRCIGDSN
jgi:hydroxymethylbilane synthase